MMTVIKDYKMPDSCLRCPFCIRSTDYPTCELGRTIGITNNTTWEKLDQVPEWCPLEEKQDTFNMRSVIYWFSCLSHCDKAKVYQAISELYEKQN